MVVVNNIEGINKEPNTVLTVGTFDGVHLGHKKIIEFLVDIAKKTSSRSVIVTFEPHPRMVLVDKKSIGILTTLEEKISLFENLGVNIVLVINFNKDFASLSSDEFLQNFLLNKIGLKEIIIGHDHKFGKDRDGDEAKVKHFAVMNNFKVTPIEPVQIDGVTVSSTIIRNYLLSGEVALANKLLGRNYSFSGEVVVGDKRGRTIGFPTINIEVGNAGKILPSTGVYAVKVFWNKHIFNGVMNIGKRPTFKNSGEIITEINLFNFDKDIYGEKVTVEVVEKIREEKKFSSIKDLVEQINKDKEKSLKILIN